VRDWTGSLLYRGKRERYLRVTDRIIQTTSRYMLCNLAISRGMRDRLRDHGCDPRPPIPARPGGDRGDPRPDPQHRRHDSRHHHRIVALSVSVQALIVFVIVIVVYQQIENYVLQPTIIRKAAQSPASPCSSASWCSERCSG
jgi:hypothetical protein